MNNDSAKKWHQLGRHVRQKEPAPSAEVRRTTPEVVRALPDMSSYVAGVARKKVMGSRLSLMSEKVSKKRVSFGRRGISHSLGRYVG